MIDLPTTKKRHLRFGEKKKKKNICNIRIVGSEGLLSAIPAFSPPQKKQEKKEKKKKKKKMRGKKLSDYPIVSRIM